MKCGLIEYTGLTKQKKEDWRKKNNNKYKKNMKRAIPLPSFEKRKVYTFANFNTRKDSWKVWKEDASAGEGPKAVVNQ